MGLDRVEDAVQDVQDGKMVIVVDEEDRENEGDLTMAAEKVSPEDINFMAKYGRGLICMPMTAERLDKLMIPLMVSDNRSLHGTAFCVSIEARDNISTGISAADRAITILTAVNSRTQPEELTRPGHIFPLRARQGGVLKRAGQTEAAVDLSRIAGLAPAGVICEVMNEDGTMARLPELMKFREKHNIRIISVVDLIKFRLMTERFVKLVSRMHFSSEFGDFDLHLFQNKLEGDLHLAFVKGDINGKKPVLVRVQKESILSDVFLSTGGSRGSELRNSLRMIQQAGLGALVYLRFQGQDQLLVQKFRRHSEEDTDFRPVDFRDYGIGAQILVGLGIHEIKLLTNHPRKMVGLEGFDLNVIEQIPIEVEQSAANLGTGR